INDASEQSADPREKISFYVDATTGQIFSQRDVDNYFKRISILPSPLYFKPLNHTKIISMLLNELSRCFESPDKKYKKNELQQLANLLDK
ncbi:MAG: hypothetical protein ABJA71_15895, partial [Ginsengibacter sp.]